MVSRLIFAALLAASTAALASPALAKKTAKHHHVVAAAPQQQIACTVIGCMPIPRECTPVGGKTPGGKPTGFDVIMCPEGTWPLK